MIKYCVITITPDNKTKTKLFDMGKFDEASKYFEDEKKKSGSDLVLFTKVTVYSKPNPIDVIN